VHDVCVDGAVLEDDILRLRPLSLDDVDEWMAGEDDEQIRWFEFARPARRDDVAQAIERWQDSWQSGGPVRHRAVCDRSTGHIAGGVEVRDLGNGEVNLSYLVFPGFRRMGIATRASRLALRYAAGEMGATIALIKILEGNSASLGVARRLGAVECGRAPSDAGGDVRGLPRRSC
jgi:RimJ/RimL family protein N-acetyltransferase